MQTSFSTRSTIGPLEEKAAASRPWMGYLLLGSILLLATVVRFYGLDAQSIWFDEGWSIHLARETLPRALGQIASEGHTHPPAYYLILMLWTRLFGSGIVAVRAFSALLGVLTVALAYWLGRTLFDRATGWIAALLLALAPAHIVYSQEVRMYALLGACYAALLALYYRYATDPAAWSRRHWAALIAVEIVAIYTHFFAFLGLAGLAGWLVIDLLRRREGRRLLPWLAGQAVAAVAFLPWLGIAWQRALTHAPAHATTPRLILFITDAWTFLMGGHIALRGREPLYAQAALAMLGVTTSLVVGSLLLRDGRRRARLYLLAQMFVSVGLVYLLMVARPGFHPRYILTALLPVAVLVAQGIVILMRWGRVGWPIGAAVAVLWLATTGLAGRAYLTDTYYARDDARATVQFLQQRLTPDGLVLLDNEDWALRYYLDREKREGFYLDVNQLPQDAAWQVEAALEGRSEVALIKWHQGEGDRRGLLHCALEQAGTLVQVERLPGYTAYLYRVNAEPPALVTHQVGVSFGPLRLVDATVETEVPADEALTVVLTWRKEAELPQDYKTALILTDEAGRPLARSDKLMRNGGGGYTREWAIGEDVTNYYTLPLGPGIAPLAYTLQVGVYHEGEPAGLDVLDPAGAPAGKHFPLATVELVPARGLTRKMLDRAAWGLTPVEGPSEVAQGLDLAAYALPQEVYRTGDRLSVLLEWHNTGGTLPDYVPELRLVRNDEVLLAAESAPVNDRYPTGSWQPDEVVLDWRDLLIPANMEGGPAELQVAVWEQGVVSLGTVEIESVERVMNAPQREVETEMPIGDLAELVGYDLPQDTVTANAPVSLTLYWRVTERTTTGYAVFCHLLSAEGKLIAQHDSAPANGQRPTTGWVRDEYIVDSHAMQWVDSTYKGQAIIEVGLYDPATGQRLATPQGDSRLLLPSSIMVH